MKLLISIILCFCLNAQAANWFVKKSASGANNGTEWTDAWTEFNQINQASLASGDVVYIAGGTYTTQLACTKGGVTYKRVTVNDIAATVAGGWNSSFDSQVIQNTSAPNSIYLNTSGLTNLTFDGRVDSGWQIKVPNFNNSGNGTAGVAMKQSCNNITLTNLEIAGPWTGSNWITVLDNLLGVDAQAANQVYTNINITHCRIHAQIDIIRLYNAANSTIENCYLYDNGASNLASFHTSVLITSSCMSNIFRFNDVSNWEANCIICTPTSGLPGEVWDIYGNVFHDSTPGENGQVLDVQYTNTHRIFFAQNTMANIWQDCTVGNGGGFASTSFGSNNIYYGIQASVLGLPHNDYDFTDAATFPSSDPHGITSGSNPFVSASDYHLNGTSGAAYPIGKGALLPVEFNKDKDGNLFLNPPSIGAYEFISSPSPWGIQIK